MLKRIFDLFVAFFALLILAPVLLVIAYLVKSKLGQPIFFRQVRPGKNGVPFEMVKFRTMRDALDENGEPLPDKERMTPFGTFLRSSSFG